jgi:hypothetical protein
LFFNDPIGGLPPYFEDFSVEICDPEDADCMANCYQMDSAPTIRFSITLLIASLFISSILSYLL